MSIFTRSAIVFGTLCTLQLISQSAGAQGIDELFRLYNLQMDGKSFKEAERTARLMVQVAPTPGWSAAAYNSLGRTLNGQERYEEAVTAFQSGLQYPLDSGNVNRGWIPNNMGVSYKSLKRYDEAEQAYKQALAEFHRMDGPTSATVATVRNNLGWLYHDQKKWRESTNEHWEALRIRRQLFGEESTEAGTSLNSLGSTYTDSGRLEEGRVELEKALAIKERTDGPESHDAAVILNNLAENASLQGDFDKANNYVRRALAIREKLYGKYSSHVANTLVSLAEYQEKAGKTDEAKATREEVSRLKEALASGQSADNPFFVGQTVQVKVPQAQVMASGKPVGSVTQGMNFEITHINGLWCGVRIVVGGEEKSGWLNSNQVTLASVAQIASAPIELKHEIVSAEGRFKIKFPRQVSVERQTVNGVQHNSYTANQGRANFVAGYFDIPSGFMLTFDAGIQAYAGARKGTVESERTITFQDEFPGRDVMIRLPDGTYSRMQLYMVGSRQYQLIIEGPKDTVTSQVAEDYFGSFEPS